MQDLEFLGTADGEEHQMLFSASDSAGGIGYGSPGWKQRDRMRY